MQCSKYISFSFLKNQITSVQSQNECQCLVDTVHGLTSGHLGTLMTQIFSRRTALKAWTPVVYRAQVDFWQLSAWLLELWPKLSVNKLITPTYALVFWNISVRWVIFCVVLLRYPLAHYYKSNAVKGYINIHI